MKEGWEYKCLGEVAVFSQGIQIDVNLQSETYSPGKVRFLRIIDVTQGNVPPRYIDDPGERYYLKADEIAMVRYGTVGFVCYGLEGVIANNLFKISIKDKSKLQSNYLQYYLKSDLFQSHIKKGVGGAALPAIKFGDIKNVILGVPPLSEQQAIVDYLDSVFAKIDAMKANAEKALNEAKAFFQASLKEMLEPKEGWEEKKFGDVCWYNRNNGLHKGTRYIGMEHIEQGTGNLLESISSDDVLSSTFAFKRGDVLYGRLRPYLKKVIVADFDGCCSTEIFPIQSKSIIAPFLMYWFLTDEITNKVNATCAGCRMPRGNMNEVLKFDISYPSLSEQQTIVDTLDSIKSKVDRLQENYDKISQECDALKQAILRQVFE